jgi:hypothetical protein
MPRRRYIFDPPDQSLLIALLKYDRLERVERSLNDIMFAWLSDEPDSSCIPTPGNPFPKTRRERRESRQVAMDAVNDYTRSRMREGYRRISPPLVISNAELDRVPRRE